MTNSVVGQLVRKDLEIMKVPIICWWSGGLVAAVLVNFGDFKVFLASTILFVTAMAGAGFHAAMQTVVEERRDKALAFIMSLPITIREYTTAKLVANLAIFGVVWVSLSGVGLYFVTGAANAALGRGTLPFLTIILVGVLLAYTIVLATSLVTESIGGTVTAIVVANLATQLFLWWVVSLDGIRSTIQGPIAVWSTTALTILAGQVVTVVGLLWATYALQARKREFI